MKTTTLALFATWLIALPCFAEEKQPAPDPKTETKEATAPKPPAISPRQAALARFKRKVAGPPPQSGRRVVAATRSGTKVPIKLVAIAPAEGGITVLPLPRLWWWQSDPSKGGELEFALTRMDDEPRTILTVKLGPLGTGFNAIDLSNPALNPERIEIEAGVDYQWTLGCFNRLKKDSVFVAMRREENAELAKRLASDPLAAGTLSSLSDSGNWYELFDVITLPSRLNPEVPDFATIRAQLLEQIALKDETRK